MSTDTQAWRFSLQVTWIDEMKNPGGIESAGAYKAKSAVRLVSPPVELPDQRGRDRLDKRLHVFAAMVAATLEDGQGGAVEAGVSIFATPEETGRQGKAKQSR